MSEIISKTGLLPALSKISKERTTQSVNLQEKRKSNFSHIQIGEDSMCIKHFWSTETYKDARFMEANEGFVNPYLISTCTHSSDEFIKSMFSNPVTNEGKVIFDDVDDEHVSGKHLNSVQETAGSKFQHFLSSLARVVLTSESHFVFCFDKNRDILSQLETYNIKELNFVRRNGFSHRLEYSDFLQRYCFLAFQFDERFEKL